MSNNAREAILQALRERAPYYVPEWRYHPDSPDAGTALAHIWADLFAATQERYARLRDCYRLELLDKVGFQPFPPHAARGYLVFRPRPDLEGPMEVPAGTAVACPGIPEAALITDSALCVSPTTLSAVYFAAPERDFVYRCDSVQDLALFHPIPPPAHIWTIRHPYAFDVGRCGTLCLAFDLRGSTDGLTYAVEYADDTAFSTPSLRRDENTLYLSFPGARAKRMTTLRFALSGKCNAEITALRAKACGYDLPADAIVTDAGDVLDASFYPFGQRFTPHMCFAIGCDDALGKPGAAVTLSFDLQFEDITRPAVPQPSPSRRKIVRAADLAPPEEAETSVSAVVWEYFNGVGWTPLTVDAQARGMFAVGNARQCKLRFFCPEDIQPIIFGAHERSYIRARILHVDHFLHPNGYDHVPIVSNVRFDYALELAITEAEVCAHCETRTVTLTEPTSLLGRLPGCDGMYFAFSRPFAEGRLLFEMTRPGAPPPLRWEYLSDGGWTPLDIQDGTRGLTQTGVLTYSTVVPAASARLFGCCAFWMRLVDESGACPELHVAHIYENAVAATARTPGIASNLPAGAFRELTFPGIASVANPFPTTGGTAPETEDRILRRLTAQFSHSGRAVTADDYSQLAYEASPRVLSARCYTNVGEDGNVAYGNICLVILQQGDFAPLRRALRAYLDSRRMLAAGALHIVEPKLVRVCVSAVLVADGVSTLTAKQRVSDALAARMNSREIGTLPSPGQIAACLREVAGIMRVEELTVSYLHDVVVTDYAHASRLRLALPANGTHSITFAGRGSPHAHA